MKKLLVLYSTRDGHTKKIVDFILKQNEQWCIDVNDLHTSLSISPEGYDQILIAASIRYGHFHPSLNEYVQKYKDVLCNKTWSFISVNLVARKSEKNSPNTNLYTKKWLEQTPVKPTYIEVVAGALQYSKYNWWQTLIIQFIMKMTGGNTDKSKDIEFTNWEKVQKFAEQLLKL